MQKRKNKYKSLLLIIGSFLFIFGILITVVGVIHNKQVKEQEEKSVNDFLQNMKNDTSEENQEKQNIEIQENKSNSNNKYNYIAVIEIPKINLKRGLVDIDDKNNNVNKNIEILKNSSMPNVRNGLLALASHSGNCSYCYFKNLNKLEEKDLIYVYYNNYKYVYEVSNIDMQNKNGNIFITRTKDTTEILLTTCDPKTNDKQIVVMGKLIDKELY